jgi:hypothetical protein
LEQALCRDLYAQSSGADRHRAVGKKAKVFLEKVAARLAECFRAEGATLKELARSYDVAGNDFRTGNIG